MDAEGAEMAEVRARDRSRRRSPNPSFAGDGSSSAPSSPSSPHSSREEGDLQCGSDRMVKMELDAARTLSEFAQMALLERGNRVGEAGGKEWGNTRRRARKRIKDGPSARACEKSFLDSGFSRSKLCPLSLHQDVHSAQDHHQHMGGSNNMVDERVKLQQNSESPDSRTKCFTSQASLCGGRAKQKLTEAEKEEKRLRRVLSNRESARQTIRRRQALCEELTKKVADLSREIENTKMEKVLVLKEYLSLKDANRKLKEQMIKTINCEVEGSLSETASMQLETPPTSSTNHPLVIYHRLPPTQFAWPSSVQPLHPAQPCFVKEVSGMANEPRSMFYMSPYTWFYPVLHQQPGSCTHSCAVREQDEGTNDGKCDLTPFSMAIGFAEKTSLRGRGRNDASKTGFITGKEKDVSNNAKTPIAFAAQEDQRLKPYPAIPVPTPRRVSSSFNVKSEPVTCIPARTVPEKLQEASNYPLKKLVDAAEARKRRKELTELKNLHGRQIRMHC